MQETVEAEGKKEEELFDKYMCYCKTGAATLAKGIEKLTSDSLEFETMDKMFDGILHTILLVWRYSKYYNTPTRLAVLIREICNTIIAQAQRFVSGPQIFAAIQNDETADAVQKIDKTLSVVSYRVLLSMLNYQTAVVRGEARRAVLAFPLELTLESSGEPQDARPDRKSVV